MRWLRRLWHKRLRRIDMEVLWPACVQNAPDLEHAKAAFAVHALNDRAWLSLGHDEVVRIIDGLETQ